MKIIKAVSNIVFLYSSFGLGTCLLLLFFDDFQQFEKSSMIVTICSLLLLMIWLIARYKFEFEENLFIKKVPAKIRLPISEATIYKIELNFGLMVFIIGIISIPVTWALWLCCLSLSICWISFFHHPHVWAKDSFDVMDRIKHRDKYRKDDEDGCFNYPISLDGFEYFYRHQNREKLTVLWCEIFSVDATMVDLGTYSEIRLIILTNSEILQIEESTSGYVKFFEKLQENLENFDSIKMLIYMSGQFSETINVYKKQ